MANKSLGQHWLYDAGALDAVVQAAGVTKTDSVLEIGPGHGTLTRSLLNQAKQVIAVEIDSGLAKQLQRKFETEPRLEIIEDDIINFDLSSLPPNYKVAANIPYYLTTPIIMKLLEANNRPAQVSLLVQKEIAERLAAKPGQLSVLGVATQALAEVKLGPVVPATLFQPKPKVDSQVVSLKPRLESVLPNHKATMALVRAGFLNRRKTLVNSLTSTLPLTKDQVIRSVTAANLKPNIRAQELKLEDWVQLAKLI